MTTIVAKKRIGNRIPTILVWIAVSACTFPSSMRADVESKIRPNTGPGAHLPVELRKEFFTAAANGDSEKMAVMLNKEPLLIDARPDNDHRTPLIIATWKNQVDSVKLLVERKADLEAEDYVWGASALGWAGWFGRPRVAEVLIAAGAEVNHPNRGGCTPLCSAQAAAKSNPKQGEGQATPEERQEIIKLLKDKGGVPNQPRTRAWPILPGWDDIQ